MKEYKKTPLIDFPSRKASIGDLIKFESEFQMYQNLVQIYKLSQTNYQTLLNNKVFCYEDIKKIKDYNTRKHLYQLGTKELDLLFPNFEFECTKNIQIPDFEDIANTDVDLENQIIQLKELLSQQDSPFSPEAEDLMRAEMELDFRVKMVNQMRLPLDRDELNLYLVQKNKLAKLNKDLMIEFICYANKLQSIKNKLFWEADSRNERRIYLEDPIEHYKENIHDCEENIEYYQKLLLMIRTFIDKQKQIGKLKMTNSYFQNLTPKIQNLRMIDIAKFEEKYTRIVKLLKRDFPDEHQKLIDVLDDNPDNHKNVYSTIFSVLIGRQLSKQAVIAYKALCSIAYREYNYGNINRLSDKIEINSADFWKLCNIKNIKNSNSVKQKIKKTIAEELREDIIYKDKDEYYCTSFILSFATNKTGRLTFQIEDMFLVADDSDDYSYYYPDLEGSNRLMEATNNSDKAYWLHHYLEHALKSNSQEFNLCTLLEKARLSDKYFVQRKRKEALKELTNFLDKMVSVQTLISKYEHVLSQSDTSKFILHNRRTKKNKSNNR